MVAQTSDTTQRQTPFFGEHLKLGAQMVPFAGWTMPLHYGSQIKEHEAVRTHAGMFDVSHMAIADVEGKDALAFLQKVLANDPAKIVDNQALYGCMLNANGGIIDDLITYRLNENHFRIIVNAATTTKDIRWLEDHSRGFEVSIQLMSDFGLMAVQGPQAREIVAGCLEEVEPCDVMTLKPFRCSFWKHLMIARTGYTGEDGVEIAGVSDTLVQLWQQLSAKGVQAAGLGARDTLRLEAGLNLYGTDMDEGTTPLESNLAWTVDMRDPNRDFIGRKALEKQKADGVPRKLVAMVIEGRGVVRSGMKVFSSDDEVGVITSGTFSPTMKKAIAFARLDAQASDSLSVELRGKQVGVTLVKPPFVRLGKICIEE